MNIIRPIVLALSFQVIAVFAWAAGDENSEIENQTKATYLYKFARYVEWPPQSFVQSDAPVTIGVLGADEVAEALSKVKEPRTASARGIVVKRLKPGDALVKSLRGVQILFIGQREGAQLKNLLDSLKLPAMLIVTESVGAISVGSMINFVEVDEHIRFEISVLRAELSGLKISARLLAVARKIETRRP